MEKIKLRIVQNGKLLFLIGGRGYSSVNLGERKKAFLGEGCDTASLDRNKRRRRKTQEISQ
ncbi:hypothetical protein [Desulfosporosinus sp. OT]|uniref:hypothetical protein n=1 Tax=Desulfosporosinus sp. OT TaxID=913865 RepID=UPI000223AE0D|nr:hypothetical protein [Desulfosporosinus sp. OT]EGW37573.1 hypothetical protein DOT_4584 [Desulfosporosinus sp. OT]